MRDQKLHLAKMVEFIKSTRHHRITQYPELEETHKDHQVRLLALHRAAQGFHHVPEHIVLNSISLGAVTVPWGACSSVKGTNLIFIYASA